MTAPTPKGDDEKVCPDCDHRHVPGQECRAQIDPYLDHARCTCSSDRGAATPSPSAATGGAPQDPPERWPDEWFPLISMMQRLGGGSANACRDLLAATLDDAGLEVRAKGQGPTAAPSEPWVTALRLFMDGDLVLDGSRRRPQALLIWQQEGTRFVPLADVDLALAASLDSLRPLSGSADSPEAAERCDGSGVIPTDGSSSWRFPRACAGCPACADTPEAAERCPTCGGGHHRGAWCHGAVREGGG